ncbi:uncharacterized protein E0L32_009120 [Thyridium curvatum]|uniref:Aminotransferase class I/classII large domain-containing protein n=1 Tax=Thyridium curvatum TaxID=1093900 RepID=A0A507AQF8_9PEZI|nr:uncharacterized protein E0L32_009120 [Thyridium curvatum]TPX09647.1 hypothetical protein E0L32_009120 [Thyridium curvatum]
MASSTTDGPKARDGSADKPLPLDMSHHFSETTKNRLPSKIKEYYKYFQIPGIGNLAGGLPNVQFFPFDTLEAQTAKPQRWTPTPNQPGDGELVDRMSSAKLSSSSSSSYGDPAAAASHITVPKTADEPDLLKKIDLATALQYGQAQGYPPLLSWIRQFTCEHLHPDVPYRGGPDVTLTVGSTDGFAKALEVFVDPWSAARGDDARARPGLVCEPFVYSNVLAQAQPKGVQAVVVEADADGMLAYGDGGLEDVLSNWDESKGMRPHLMYTVTMGHNPTGILLGMKRRQELYAVCSRYDVIIVEDDPYWYLQYPSAAAEEARSRGLASPRRAEPSDYRAAKSSGYPFLDSLTPSFLAIDVDGRVVRLDTFSKTVAPGCRLGWVTAQPALIERFVRVSESGTQQPSGFVQSVISELVMGGPGGGRGKDRAAPFAGWKTDGWVRWLEGLRGEYERRMQRMCRTLDDGSVQLKQGTPLRACDADWGVVTKTRLLSFDWPRAGMFVWVRAHFESHPLWRRPARDGRPIDGPALSTALMMFLIRKPWLVLVTPGSMFSATDEVRRERGWAYYRLCFAAESDANVDSCSKRFVAGVHKFWKIKSVEELEDLLGDAPDAASVLPEPEDGEQVLGNLGTFLGC